VRRLTAAALAAGPLIWDAGATRALECPLAQPATTATALQESPETIRDLSALLAAQGTDVVPEIVAGLRRRYPGAQDAEIANYLVTLYCPVVNRDAALSDSEKSGRLGAFASQVMLMLARR
jgi:hypothetical protein